MPGLLEEPSSSQSDVQKGQVHGQKVPKGVVLGKDGKPCRTCTSTSDWLAMMRTSTSKKPSQQPSPSSSSTAAAATLATTAAATTTLPSSSQPIDSPSPIPQDCPPDVEELGRSTWTLLHSLIATYPETPTPTQKSNVRQFLALFSQLYPCWVCAEDFRDWMVTPGNEPKVGNTEEFGRWMCRAHNAVNVKLGKTEFDCDLWRQRWKDGWKDGRCG